MAILDSFMDSGSNYNFTDKLMRPNSRYSQFDLSYVNNFTAKQGEIIPCWFSYYYPGDDISLTIDNLLRVVNVPVVPLMSRMRVFFHMFKIDYSQMWDIWDTFMKKGWSGNFEAVLPTLSAPLAVNGKINPLLARGSLADFLGFNLSDYKYKSGDEDITVVLPAMPFLAYQLIYRAYYLNFNVASAYALKNPDSELNLFFPDSDYELMLQGANPQGLTLDGSNKTSPSQPLNNLAFGKLRYRDFAPDYFTTALPWPMKGNTPSINFDVSGDMPVRFGTPGRELVSLWTDNLIEVFANPSPESGQAFVKAVGSNNREVVVDHTSGQWHEQVGRTGITNLKNILVGASGTPKIQSSAPVGLNADLSSLSLSLTQPILKLLWTNTLISEKMARTDGSYGQFVKTFFGETPSHWNSHLPEYLGGTYQPIVFSEVLQTSPASSGTLGTVGAKGISSSQGFVGRFHANDFGIAMCLMSIMPDTYYSQGWLKEHLYRTQDDFPLPERALLGMQPVTNAEIFFNARKPDENNTLFGYQSRFDELRYRYNEVHGEMADNENLTFSPYVQSRDFAQAPQLNPQFLTTEGNIDNAWLSAPNESVFAVQIANRVNATRALPYEAPPSAIMI